MRRTEYLDILIHEGLKLGAKDVVGFEIDDIVFDQRTLLKCMFGCEDWGKGHTCPSRPGSPSLDRYQRIFKEYEWGVIIHAEDKKISQLVSLALERRAFADDYYFAFSLSDCALCSRCAGKSGEPCNHVRDARPAFQSVGIDVFATVRRFNLPIHTLTDPEGEIQNWYSAVFIE